MKTKTKRIFALILIIMLAVLLISCNSGSDNGGDNPPDGGSPVAPEALELVDKVTNGLRMTGNNYPNMDVRHVYAEYTVRASQINFTLVQEANYNEKRKQDSEILFRVFDNQYAKNTMFLYYYGGKLYYEINDEKYCISDFGNTRSFDVFYEIMQAIDFGTYFFADPDSFKNDEEFVEAEDILPFESFATYLGMIIIGAETDSLSIHKTGANSENIRITDVVLDQGKEPINNFLQNVVKHQIGTRLDALTEMLLGFKLSAFGNLGIGQLNASTINISINNGSVDEFDIVFDGMQTDNINDFLVSVKYRLNDRPSRVMLTQYEDPEIIPTLSYDDYDDGKTNAYWLTRSGEYHYTGTIFIDSFKQTFYTDIRANLNTTNNGTNQFLVDIRDKTMDLPEDSPYYADLSMISLYYANETLYVDLQGIMENYIGNTIMLSDLNFPKVKFENLDMSKELGGVYSYLLSLMSTELNAEALLRMLTGSSDGFGKLSLVMSKINSKGSVIEFTLDQELISGLMEDYSDNMIIWLASTLGISSEDINSLLGSGAFNNISITLTYDYKTGEYTVSLFNGGARMFILTLYKQIIKGDAIEIIAPKGFNAADYSDMETPEAIRLHLEGELAMQGKDSVDFSRLLGVFIGDNTGTNTPFNFRNTDKFYISGDVWYENGYTYVMATLWYNPQYTDKLNPNNTAKDIISAPLLKIYTSPDEPEYYLIDIADVNFADSVKTPVKYKISREGLSEAFSGILEDDSLFTSTNIMDILSIVTRDTTVYMSDEYMTFTLAPYTANGISYDPIKDLIGIDNMLGTFKARILFDKPDITVNVSEFEEPYVESLTNLMFSSMYEAVWHESADVFFANGAAVNFKLTFRGDSAEMKTGVYHYTPIARLFGQDVSYVMILTDGVNGTKKITDLGISVLTIDPADDKPIDDMIDVIYDDGTVGRQPYIIEGFPFNENTIKNQVNGVAAKNYTIVIGEGSIAKIEFMLPVEILNRNIVAYQFVGTVPVLAIESIDPYDYSLKKRENAQYDPLAKYRTMEIQFYSNVNYDMPGEKIEVDLNWDFDETLIEFRGRQIYLYAFYKNIKVALEVNIIAKIVDYIQISGEIKGEYTIDALRESTYQIPATSRQDIQIRIYFKTYGDVPAHYRIIGNAQAGDVTDMYFDGYYPDPFIWQLTANNITLDNDVNPLDNGRTNINRTTFGNNIAGVQSVTLKVNSPSRRVSNMPDRVTAITSLVIYADGSIDDDNTVRQSVEVSAIGFGEIGVESDTNGKMFKVDPYAAIAANRLPAAINMTVEYAGSLIRTSYTVEWIASSIIDGSGNVLTPTSQESYLRATGYIGDATSQQYNRNRQIITVIIHNMSGEYESITIVNPNTGQEIKPRAINPITGEEEEAEKGLYIMEINPYSDYQLPESFILQFSAASGHGAKEYTTDWRTSDGKTVSRESFSYMPGDTLITTFIEADPSSGTLAQTIRLYIRVGMGYTVIKDTVYDLSNDFDRNNISTINGKNYVVVDIYDPESASILNKLEGNTVSYGVRFANNAITHDIPIEWDNVQEVMDVLKRASGSSNYPDGIVTLRGHIYSGNAALQQEVNLNLMVSAQQLTGMTFAFIRTDFQDSDILGIDITFAGIGGETANTITLEIFKPYALINKIGRLGFDQGENMDKLLTLLIYEMLSDVTFTIAGIQRQLTLYFDDWENDKQMNFFNFAYEGGTLANVNFNVFKMGEGSSAENFVFIVKNHRDEIITGTIEIGEETFNPNGTLKHTNENGYAIPVTVTIEYVNSGEVRYTNLPWCATSNFYDDRNNIVINQGEEVKAIPASLFRTMRGNTVNLNTQLDPQEEYVTLTISFFAKDIKEFVYNATAETAAYNIGLGRILINNIYDIYPFNASRLPTTISPERSSTYQYAEGNLITFAVRWVPGEMFADSLDPSQFSQEKINNLFNYRGFNSGYDAGEGIIVFATAEILMYNNEMQTIKLCVDVAALSQAEITHTKVDFQNNKLTLDPYFNNFLGNYTLPKDIKVGFTSGTSTVSTSFLASSAIAYSIAKQDGEEYIPILSIPYSHEGHLLGRDYGEPTAELKLRVRLPDGQEIDITINFLSRILDRVEVDNRATKDDPNTGGIVNGKIIEKYYIDPYDETTHTLPKTADFIFETGGMLKLDITEWQMGENGGLFDAENKLIWQADTYKGGVYNFSSSLKGYGDTVEAQVYPITVIILDRSLKTDKKQTLQQTYEVADPVACLVSDIEKAKEITANMFVIDDMKTTDLYKDYFNITEPLLPSLSFKECSIGGEKVAFTNDRIGFNGFSYTIYGGIGSGEQTGEGLELNIWAKEWEFVKLEDVSNGLIEFNPFTNESFETEFRVQFRVGGAEMKIVTFYTLAFANEQVKEKPDDVAKYEAAREETMQLRHIIDWGDRSFSSDRPLRTFKLGNDLKNLNINFFISVNVYSYVYSQILIDELDLGFGDGFKKSGEIEFVIDPFNPVIPTQALAKGKETVTGEERELGMVDVVWDSAIYNMKPSGGSSLIEANVISATGGAIKLNVIVHYLNRTPERFMTRSRGFSTTGGGQTGVYLLQQINDVNNYFEIDPINDITYNPQTGKYLMPTDIIVVFKSQYSYGDATFEGRDYSATFNSAIDKLGSTLTLSEIKWRLSGEVTLSGTYKEGVGGITSEPLIAYLDGFKVSYDRSSAGGGTETVTSKPYDFTATGTNPMYDLKLNVTNRLVESTSVSYMVQPTDGSAPYQKALSQYFVDPYAINFPSTISVKFTNEGTPKIYNGIVWNYDEDYLMRPDVISGAIAKDTPEAMNLMASITILGTTLKIQFPIKARNIDTTIPGSSATQPLSGGRLYVLKGIPIAEQLPKFLYYRFILEEEDEMAAVPLSFSETTLHSLSTDVAGIIYTGVSATLGKINSNNIEFTIEVIDPLVYNIKTILVGNAEIHTNGGFIYDSIHIAIGSGDYYIEGKEKTLLPNIIIINANGEYLTVSDVVFDTKGGFATFNCKYTFLTYSDSLDLAGNNLRDDDSNKLEISFKVPLTIYNHTAIDESLSLNERTIRVPLGIPLNASEMPKAYSEKGVEYTLFWDFNNLQINRAGEYTAYGYYKTTYNNDIAVQLTVIVEEKRATDSDISVSATWLNREYNGEIQDITPFLTISYFLREDGSLGAVGYIVEYSTDGGVYWSTIQPTYARETPYLVRISIDDYNVTGYRIFNMTIRQKLINESDISFHTDENAPPSANLVYEYNGSEIIPVIKGIPIDVNGTLRYNIRYLVWNGSEYVDASPINAGTYLVELIFPAQTNYIATAERFTCYMTITRKTVTYTIVTELTYNGKERNAEVQGIPEILGDMTVTYLYFNENREPLPIGSGIKNVGLYYVTIMINGGTNYPSANLNMDDPNLTMRLFSITPQKIILTVNTLETEYLEPLKAFNSGVTFVDYDDNSLNGLKGDDILQIATFRAAVSVRWEGGTLTYKHMVGDYTLAAIENVVYQNYTIMEYVKGTYKITANALGVEVVSNAAELQLLIASLQRNSTVKWYLRAGDYGSIVIDVDATVSIIGSYNLSSATEEIAVSFTSILVNRGGVTIDIVKIASAANSSGILVGENAAGVTVNRSQFYRKNTSSYLTNSVAIKTDAQYSNILSVTETSIEGFAIAVYMLGGSADIRACKFDNNITGVQVRDAENILLIDNQFNYTKGTAVYVLNDIGEENLSISGNMFIGNIVALKTHTQINENLLPVQNTLKYNSIDIQYV